MMICSISGQQASDPVISPKSGAIFDRKHIESYISTAGTDPISDQPLTVEELIAVKTSVSEVIPPRISSATSIPALLSTFQNEWDALALEVFTLRKQLYKAREELSAALYHHDAAVRVAANAIRERDEAKAALQELAISIGKLEVGETAEAVNNSENGNGKAIAGSIDEIPAEEINQAREVLFSLHKSQKPVFDIAPDAQISVEFIEKKGQPFKKSTASFLDSETKLLLVGTSTGQLAKFAFAGEGDDILTKSTASKGTITAVNFVLVESEPLPIIAYKNKIIIGQNKRTFKNNHSGAILQILVHPKLTNLFITLGEDNVWALHDSIREQSLLYQSPMSDSNIRTGDFHPDGALFAIGNDSKEVKVYGTSTAEQMTVLEPFYTNVIKVKFAPNGYWLLVGSTDGEKSRLDVFDLRKSTLVHNITFEEPLRDFVIDPSSSIVVSLGGSNTIALHKYIKKGKQWKNNYSMESFTNLSTLQAIHLLTNVNDESFKNENEIRFVGVAEDSTVQEFNLSYG